MLTAFLTTSRLLGKGASGNDVVSTIQTTPRECEVAQLDIVGPQGLTVSCVVNDDGTVVTRIWRDGILSVDRVPPEPATPTGG